MISKEELQRAIGVHLLWKARLKAAVESGLSLPAADSLRRDDLCEFGKWLRDCAVNSGPPSDHLQTVDQLHAAFHQAAAIVVDLDLRGDSAAAIAQVAPGGAFQETSARLLAAMKAWHESLPQPQ
jgi:hypothetical protein